MLHTGWDSVVVRMRVVEQSQHIVTDNLPILHESLAQLLHQALAFCQTYNAALAGELKWGHLG
jgi:hypothetical protein